MLCSLLTGITKDQLQMLTITLLIIPYSQDTDRELEYIERRNAGACILKQNRRLGVHYQSGDFSNRVPTCGGYTGNTGVQDVGESDHTVCEEDAYSDFRYHTTRVVRESFESGGNTEFDLILSRVNIKGVAFSIKPTVTIEN